MPYDSKRHSERSRSMKTADSRAKYIHTESQPMGGQDSGVEVTQQTSSLDSHLLFLFVYLSTVQTTQQVSLPA